MINNTNQTFDDIVILVQDAYLSVIKAFGVDVDEEGTKNEIKGLMNKLFQKEINQYGWAGREKLASVIVEWVFHETFSGLSPEIYAVYLQNNFMELNLDVPFELEDIESEKRELERTYKEAKVTLTDAAYISEMKRALHYHLFMMYTDFQEILLSEQHLQHIKPNTEVTEKELVVQLQKELKEARKLRDKVNDLLDRMQSLDDRYM